MLSKKAQQFLEGIELPKAQKGMDNTPVGGTPIVLGNGLQFPYQTSSSQQFQQPTPYPYNVVGDSSAITNINTNVSDTIQANAGAGKNTSADTAAIMSNEAFGALGALGQIGIGIGQYFKGRKQQRIAKYNEQLFKEDLKQRKEQMRDSFYMTPYTVGRSDDLTMKDGGLIKYQAGGNSSVDAFMNYYFGQEQGKKDSLEDLNMFYSNLSADQKRKAKDMKMQGISNALAGWNSVQASGKKIASALMGNIGGATAGASAGVLPIGQQGGVLSIMPTSSTILDATQKAGTEIYNYLNNLVNPTPVEPTFVDNPQIPLEETLRNRALQNKITIDRHGYLGNSSSKSKSIERYREKQEGGVVDTESLYSPDYDPGHRERMDSSAADQEYEDQQSLFYEQLFKTISENRTSGRNIDYTEMDFNSRGQGKGTSVNIDFNPNSISMPFADGFSFTGNTNQSTQSFQVGQTSEGTDVSSLVPNSIAVSHNNPGNIKFGDFAKKYGAVPERSATDGGVFAKFPTVEAGMKAQRDLLKTKTYQELTVAEAMERWSNKGYGADLVPEIANKKVKYLTEEEFESLIRAQTKREDPRMYKILYGQ